MKSRINYRKIYEDHHGSIPVDETGRTFDIHHLDSNRENNAIDNLIALSRNDHIELHKSQGDYGAAFLLAKYSELSPAEFSKIAKLNQQKLLDEGKHYFQTEECKNETRKMHARAFIEEKHYFQTEEHKSAIKDRIKKVSDRLLTEGRHISQNEEYKRDASVRMTELNQKMISEGSHITQNEEFKLAASKRTTERMNKLVSEGKHPMFTEENRRKVTERNERLLLEGKHPSQIKMSCDHCKTTVSKSMYVRWHGDKCKKKVNNE